VLEPDAGQVRWRGSPIDEQTRRRTGYMPEDYGQTFLQKCAGACSRREHASKHGGRARHRRTRSRPPGSAGNWMPRPLGWSHLESTAMRSKACMPPRCTSSLSEPTAVCAAGPDQSLLTTADRSSTVVRLG
jgi:hypothetical protein